MTLKEFFFGDGTNKGEIIIKPVVDKKQIELENRRKAILEMERLEREKDNKYIETIESYAKDNPEALEIEMMKQATIFFYRRNKNEGKEYSDKLDEIISYLEWIGKVIH